MLSKPSAGGKVILCFQHSIRWITANDGRSLTLCVALGPYKGITMTMSWVTARRERACELHAGMYDYGMMPGDGWRLSAMSRQCEYDDGREIYSEQEAEPRHDVVYGETGSISGHLRISTEKPIFVV